MKFTHYTQYHLTRNPKYVVYSILLLLFINFSLIFKNNSKNMFILKKGVITLNNYINITNNTFSNSKIIFIYPDKDLLRTNQLSSKHRSILYTHNNKNLEINTRTIIESDYHDENENIQTHSFLHKKKYPNLYSKSLISELYSKELPNISADYQKQNSIKEAFLHSWKGYKKYCWNHDIFHPVSKTCTDFLHGGLTIIDSLPTLIIMELDDELEYSKKFIEKKFNLKGEWSLFEFIIRYIGSFISAYYLSNDDFYKRMAIMLGEAVYPIIKKKSGFFSSRFYIEKVQNEFKASTNYSTKFLGLFHEQYKNLDCDNYVYSEVGSFQMEFLALTEITGDKKYANLALNVYRELWNNQKLDGLISNSIGGGYDSYYEYIIKTYLQTRGSSPALLSHYTTFTSDLQKKLVIQFKKFTFIGVKTRYFLRPSIEYFTTFAAGMLAIGSVKENKNAKKDFELAADLSQTYVWLHRYFKSGLAPDDSLTNLPGPRRNLTKSDSNSDDFLKVTIQKNVFKLRPETVESLFWLWKFTGDVKYRKSAWEIFKAINRTCRVGNGFTSVFNIEKEKPDFGDEMESFFLAETLKYLYLIFSESSFLSPVDWVFNTEAHPFKMLSKETVKKISDLLEIGNEKSGYEIKNDVKKHVVKTIRKRGIIQGPFDEKNR